MQPKILVIEDDVVISRMLETALTRKGYGVRTVGAGLEGCRVTAEEHPDLILLDVMLPDLDGWEILSMIRTLPDPRLSAIPIIMVTSRASEEDRLRGLRIGADDYVTKPFSLEELLLRVDRLLSRDAGRTEWRPEEPTLEDLEQILHHELKNHLVAIAGFGRRIEAKAESIDPKALRRYGGFIRKSAEHLNSFAEDLLLFQKFEAGRWEARREAVDLSLVVDIIVRFVRPLAEEKGIDLRTTIAEVPPVWFNETAARTCLSNLLENALKYTPEKGKVGVVLGHCGDRVCLDVTDTGPGIPPEEAEGIFEKFYRGSSQARATKGTGLGLYLVKKLTETLGASVILVGWDEGNQDREGSWFRMTFEAVGKKDADA